MISKIEMLRAALRPFAELIYPQRATGQYPIIPPLAGGDPITVAHVEAARWALEQTSNKAPYAGHEPTLWRDDPENAPCLEWVLAFGQGGIVIKILDEHGNWRGRSGRCDSSPLGSPKAAPSHWMLLPEPPFEALGANPPRKGKPKRKLRNVEGLAGAV